MANGISDILGVYRETLASERESRMGEMQMALSMMQYESERMFREEGRRREDAYQGLASTKATLTQALGQDVSTVLAGLSSLYTMEEVDDRLVPEKMSNKVRKKLGLSENDETEIYNIVLMSSSDSATMQASAVESAKQFSERVAAEYKYWKAQEVEDPLTDAKSPLLKSLTKAGILYGGEDKVRESLSFEPFLGVSTGRVALESVNLEMSEITSGDYEIQRGDEIAAGLGREPYEYDEDVDAVLLDDITRRLEADVTGGAAGARADILALSEDIKDYEVEVGKLEGERDIAFQQRSRMANYINETLKRHRIPFQSADPFYDPDSPQQKRMSNLTGVTHEDVMEGRERLLELISETPEIAKFVAEYERSATEWGDKLVEIQEVQKSISLLEEDIAKSSAQVLDFNR